MKKTKAANFQEKLARLFKIADSQQGFFTAKQAESVGFLPTNFTYHVKNGIWIREGRGIYRLKNFPQEQVKAQYAFYSLWSRDRDDKPQGVYGHETALSIYELSDVMPAKIHMIVPKSFRKWAKTPKVLVLHYQDLKSKDVQSWNGINVTKPLTTVLNLMEANQTSPEFIQQAFAEGVERGLIPLYELRSEKIRADIKDKFQSWLTLLGPSQKSMHKYG